MIGWYRMEACFQQFYQQLFMLPCSSPTPTVLIEWIYSPPSPHTSTRDHRPPPPPQLPPLSCLVHYYSTTLWKSISTAILANKLSLVEQKCRATPHLSHCYSRILDLVARIIIWSYYVLGYLFRLSTRPVGALRDLWLKPLPPVGKIRFIPSSFRQKKSVILW